MNWGLNSKSNRIGIIAYFSTSTILLLPSGKSATREPRLAWDWPEPEWLGSNVLVLGLLLSFVTCTFSVGYLRV